MSVTGESTCFKFFIPDEKKKREIRFDNTGRRRFCLYPPGPRVVIMQLCLQYLLIFHFSDKLSCNSEVATTTPLFFHTMAACCKRADFINCPGKL